jgi:hypothetical protein
MGIGNRRQTILAVLVGAILVIALWQRRGADTPAVGAGAAGVPSAGKLEDIPWIDLDRLNVADQPPAPLGKRDPFKFAPTAPPPPPPGAGGVNNGGMPTAAPTEPPPSTPTPPPPPPPMTIKFIGMVEKQGRKIAVLMSDQKEILHGREGDVLGGRYRIVKIGFESVDLQDVTTGQSQRIALRGN